MPQPDSDSGTSFMFFDIIILNDTTVCVYPDTLKLNRFTTTDDMLAFSYFEYDDPGNLYVTQHSPTWLYYTVKSRKIFYSARHDAGKWGNYNWQLNVSDTNVTAPATLLATYTPLMSNTRQWYVHRAGAISMPDTTIAFAIHVIDDSTMQTKSFWTEQSNASLSSSPDNVVLFYAYSDPINKSMTFRSNYYPLNGGSLTYYYIKDSMVYDYTRHEGDPWFTFHLSTR